MMNNMHEDLDKFVHLALFFDAVFETAKTFKVGDIGIRTLLPDCFIEFCTSPEIAAVAAHELIQQGHEAFYGINPQCKDSSGDYGLEYICAFHTEIPFGQGTQYETLQDVLKTVHDSCFIPGSPSIIVSTDDAIQCLWFLKYPVSVEEAGYEPLEKVNMDLASSLGGNMDACGLTEYFKVPAYELPQQKVVLISNNRFRYLAEDFGLNTDNFKRNMSSMRDLYKGKC